MSLRDGMITVTPEGGTSNNPFENAKTLAFSTQAFVEAQFSYLKNVILGEGGSALQGVDEAINALSTFDFTLPEGGALVKPEVNWDVNLDFNLPPVNATTFGTISDFSAGPTPVIGTLPSISDPNIPGFNPSVVSLNIPDAPDPAIFIEPGGPPDAPVLVFPDVPVITLPDKPLLQQIDLPDRPIITLPTLDLVAFPELEAMNINTYIDWSEPAYAPEIWDDVKAQILAFFAGGSGILPAVEDQMVARSRDREDRLIRQNEQQATEEVAARGYTAIPGTLLKRIDKIREEGMTKKLGLQREVTIKAMEEELANVRLAVQQGIVAENLFVQIHLAAVERLFLIERLHVEWEIQKYNLLVEAYKAKLSENQIRAQVYEVQVRAALAEIEVFKAFIDAELAKAEINKALVEAYKAEIEAREALVNIYVAEVRAVEVRAQVFATEIAGYRGEVEAFAARVDADKSRFEAYEARVRGEAAKASIIEAEARAYSAEVTGIEVGVRAESAALDGAVNAFRAEVDGYEAALRGHIAKNQAELAGIQANVAGYQADTQRFIAATGAEEARSRAELSAWETENRLNLAYFEAQIKEFEMQLSKIIAQKDLLLDAIKAQGQLSSTVSAGAMAAMHAGATMSGSGGVSASGTDGVSFSYGDSQSKSCSTSNSANINYEADSQPNLDCPI